MACVLTRRKEDGVFVGRTGQKIRIDVRSKEPAALVRLVYAGAQDGEPPSSS